MVDYSNAKDKEIFINEQQIDKQWSNAKIRFMAYQALSLNLNLISYGLFAELTYTQFGDFLAAALAKARLGEWKNAEQMLNTATRLTASFKPYEIKVLHDLLVQIRRNSGLELFDDAYVERIGGEASSEDAVLLPPLPEVSVFCPEV